MPRQDAVWLNLQVSQEEKDILTEYAHSNRKSRVEVVREFIRSLQPPELGDNPCARKAELDEINAHMEQKEKDFLLAQERYRPKAIHHDPEVREWLQSLGAEADQELADAASLRAMAAHMLTIAERLEK